MNRLCKLAVVFAIVGSGCSSAQRIGDDMGSHSIALKERPTESGKYVTEIEILVDGHSQMFLFDTGAATSSIRENTVTKNYPVLGTEESKGASGKGKTCDVIQPSVFTIGQNRIPGRKMKRCEHSILGLDLLEGFIFQIDLAQKRLSIINQLPSTQSPYQATRLKRGHLIIPVKLSQRKARALFDTGADTTVIDSLYVKDNPGLFKFVRKEQGTDAHGHKTDSKTYMCHSVEIGGIKLENVEVAAFDFGEFLRKRMEGVPIILGNNVIAKAQWSFDLKVNQWTVMEN